MTREPTSEEGEDPDYGDVMDSDDEFEVMEGAEPVEAYRNGVYYPVSIGDVLTARYRVQHKLGWGGYSTVWLAYDMHQQKNVALKIMTAGEKGEREYEMHDEILRIVCDTSHLVTYQDAFVLSGLGSNQHRVLVLPLLGPSLTYRTKQYPAATRVSGAKQLLIALKGLHDAGLVHRDLNEGAIMWDMPSVAKFNRATIYEKLGRPQKILLSTLIGDDAWKDGEYVLPVLPPIDYFGKKLYLGDFGLAMKEGTPVRTTVQAPYNYCAPERIHGQDPSRASDMWSYMCLFCSLYLGYSIFAFSGEFLANHWFEYIGPMPVEWKGKFWWEDSSKDEWYDNTSVADPKTELAKRIARLRPDTSQEEREHVLSVMQKGFCYLPEHRITAGQLLEDPSFKAIMEIYGC